MDRGKITSIELVNGKNGYVNGNNNRKVEYEPSRKVKFILQRREPFGPHNWVFDGYWIEEDKEPEKIIYVREDLEDRKVPVPGLRAEYDITISENKIIDAFERIRQDFEPDYENSILEETIRSIVQTI
jgi:hypothetical protein